MTKSTPYRVAFLAVLTMIAGFVLPAPAQATTAPPSVVAVSGQPDAVHLPGAATRSNTTNPLPYQGFLGHTPVDLTPRAQVPPPRRVLVAAAHRVRRTPESVGYTPLGERAPPVNSGS